MSCRTFSLQVWSTSGSAHISSKTVGGRCNSRTFSMLAASVRVKQGSWGNITGREGRRGPVTGRALPAAPLRHIPAHAAGCRLRAGQSCASPDKGRPWRFGNMFPKAPKGQTYRPAPTAAAQCLGMVPARRSLG